MVIENEQGFVELRGGVDDDELTDADAEGETDPDYDSNSESEESPVMQSSAGHCTHIYFVDQAIWEPSDDKERMQNDLESKTGRQVFHLVCICSLI